MDLSNKNKAYLTLGLFSLIALAFWYYSDTFSAWAATSNPILVMVVSIVINPAYLVLIYWLYKDYNFRGIIAGILISVAIDVISLAHSINKLGILPTGDLTNPLYAYSDTTIYKLIYPLVSGPTGAFIVYVTIPGILMYLALRVIRKTASFNRIMKESL